MNTARALALLEAMETRTSALPEVFSAKPTKRGVPLPIQEVAGVLPLFFTENRLFSVVRPIPTLPSESMRRRSAFFVYRRNGMLLVVPSLEVVLALLLPDKLQY